MRIQTTILSLLALASTAMAQNASVQLMQSECNAPEGTPGLVTTSTPILGTNFDISYTGPNHVLDFTQSSAQPVFVLGFNIIGPVEIPQGIFRNQPFGCELVSTHDIVVPMAPGRSTYNSTVTLPIANNSSMMGFVFFAQWMTQHVQCGFAGCDPVDWLATSETAICTIGV